MCDCGRTTAMYIVRINKHGNQGHLFFVCPSKYSNKEHYNYFKFADNDDEDVTFTNHSNTGPRKAIRTEEFNDVRTRLSKMKNEIHDHGKRLQMMDKNFKAMIYRGMLIGGVCWVEYMAAGASGLFLEVRMHLQLVTVVVVLLVFLLVAVISSVSLLCWYPTNMPKLAFVCVSYLVPT
ncbi:hypothetical protein TEA_016253 [Camellia sinensis var. sinensis]|uniref:GRF-type domain-containing protein n=1 Tax=Camellia sinensis var. sinensis TaxID=542762 RepID=A0A4S4EWP3_CAMSN|nr:hypothetical protein TEA_016253 [Camellia sinensis var. sinensis]